MPSPERNSTGRAMAGRIDYDINVRNGAGRVITHVGSVDLQALANDLRYGIRTTAMDWQARADAARRQVLSLVDTIEFRIAPARRPVFDAAFQGYAEALLLAQIAAGTFTADQLDGATLVIRLQPDTVRHWLQ